MLRNPKVAVVLIIVALLAIGFLFRSTIFPPKLDVVVKCSDKACAAVSTVPLAANTAYPIVCPQCKKVTAQPASKYHNPKTKKEIVLLPDENVPADFAPGELPK